MANYLIYGKYTKQYYSLITNDAKTRLKHTTTAKAAFFYKKNAKKISIIFIRTKNKLIKGKLIN
jgi:hypothetical protein